jgi:serpin B
MWKKKLLFVVFIVLMAGCGPAAGSGKVLASDLPRNTTPQVSDSTYATLVSDNNDFAFKMYHQLAQGNGDLFFSPFSISEALAMTYAGAAGDTASQMALALNFTLPQASLHPAFNRLALDLASRSEQPDLEPDQQFRLNIANAIWGQSGYSFLSDFLDTLAQNYGAGLRLLDFMADPESARQTINSWVTEQTADKIKDLVPPGAIDTMTRLVLTNAIYFNASWANAFEENNTTPAPFHLADGTQVEVQMMSQQDHFGYVLGAGYRAIDLPYVGYNLSMTVIVPDEGRLGDIEASIGNDFLANMANQMKYGLVNLYLPKWKVESSFELIGAMSALGMTDAFDPTLADFSGMDGQQDLYIGAIIHKAYVSVDEKGTEAAAATAVVMETTAIQEPQQPVEFRVDHPFLFLIRDNVTGTILFIGRVIDPGS